VSTNNSFDKFLQEKLDERKANGLLRSLVFYNDKIDFSSNDYLGFAQLQQLKQTTHNTLPSGSTGSRLITGNPLLAEETEKIIADFHHAEAALIFNSGYCANVGLFSCIANKGDTLITDEFIHASIIDGARLNHANRYKFKHNNIEDLEKKLQQASGKKIVAVESIYSMDGDEAPLKEIVTLCKKHEAILIVDEAHAIGVFGDKGEGLVCKYNLQKEVFACIYTFGKALGLHGAVITGSNTLRNYLINHARSFIYTTALPPHTYLELQQAYKLLPTANRKILFELIDHYRSVVQKIRNISFIESSSTIQTIIIGDNKKAKDLANHLVEKGFFAKAILSPTVPIGTERLRICLHSFNTSVQIDALLQEVNTFLS
jgi:8-amino-7-oxononanoate synthase